MKGAAAAKEIKTLLACDPPVIIMKKKPCDAINFRTLYFAQELDGKEGMREV